MEVVQLSSERQRPTRFDEQILLLDSSLKLSSDALVEARSSSSSRSRAIVTSNGQGGGSNDVAIRLTLARPTLDSEVQQQLASQQRQIDEESKPYAPILRLLSPPPTRSHRSAPDWTITTIAFALCCTATALVFAAIASGLMVWVEMRFQSAIASMENYPMPPATPPPPPPLLPHTLFFAASSPDRMVWSLEAMRRVQLKGFPVDEMHGALHSPLQWNPTFHGAWHWWYSLHNGVRACRVLADALNEALNDEPTAPLKIMRCVSVGSYHYLTMARDLTPTNGCDCCGCAYNESGYGLAWEYAELEAFLFPTYG